MPVEMKDHNISSLQVWKMWGDPEMIVHKLQVYRLNGQGRAQELAEGGGGDAANLCICTYVPRIRVVGAVRPHDTTSAHCTAGHAGGMDQHGK